MKYLSHRSLSPLSLRVFITTLLAIFTLCAQSLTAQGTFLYDQQSSTNPNDLFTGASIQFYGSVGQSFTPSLSAIDFVQLKVGDLTLGNSVGATMVVNIRANAINGPILGSSTPVSMIDGFRGVTNFLFASSISLNPTTTYFLETFVQSGDNWGITALGDTYANGTFYGGLTSFSANELWFREGIVVPEPSAIALFLGSGTSLWFLRRKKQR